MNAQANGGDDWALVVGIAHYPHYGPTPNDDNDLGGPVHDAQDVASFLKTDYGVKNVTLLTSLSQNGSAWTSKARPIRSDIEAWLQELMMQSLKNVQAGSGPRVGRRLYIYLSGHGLAPRKSDRALVTANAMSRTLVDHVLATSWHEHLCNTKYFDEYVLWMDCCTQARVTLLPSVPPFEVKPPLIPRPPQVLACAAKYPYLAVELPLGPGGEFRGVFTYELLQGLRGAAENPVTGGIRTRDIKEYLSSAIPRHIAGLANSSEISTEADFLEEDDIEFKPAHGPPGASKRRIIFAGAKVPPEQATVRAFDHARRLVGQAEFTARELKLVLAPGWYKLDWGSDHVLIEVNITDGESIHG